MIYLITITIVTYAIAVYSLFTILKKESETKSRKDTFPTKFEQEIKRILES